VIEAYVDLGSCLKASLQPGVFVSSATVSRVVNAALEAGLLDAEMKRGPGRPRVDAAMIVELMSRYPYATIAEIAGMAGVSESTVYRVKQDE
jgi:transposase